MKIFATPSSFVRTLLKPAVPPGIVYGDTRTLDYPPLLAPLASPRFLAASTLVVGLVCAIARAQAAAWLRRTKVRDLAGLGLLLLLLLQELRLDARLLNDFRPVTGGSWGVVDNYILHALRRLPASPPTSYVHAFHGFGANSLSWRPLLDALDGGSAGANPAVVAHDTPGFGFTPRPRNAAAVVAKGLFPAIYRPIWGARASLALGDCAAANKHIFMGHSMGAISAIAAAAAAAASSPSPSAATNVTVVLLALAFSIATTADSARADIDADAVLRAVKEAVDAAPDAAPTDGRRNALVSTVRAVVRALQRAWQLPLVLLLRRAVHSDWFWRQGLGASWGRKAAPSPSSSSAVDSSPRPLDEADIFRYKLASMAARFDDDLFRFVAAQRLAQPGSFPSPEIVPGVTQAVALAALVQKGACVVVLHGTADRIVPLGTSLRMQELVRALAPDAPGTFDVVPMTGYGHLPHEENAVYTLDTLKDLVDL